MRDKGERGRKEGERDANFQVEDAARGDAVVARVPAAVVARGCRAQCVSTAGRAVSLSDKENEHS